MEKEQDTKIEPHTEYTTLHFFFKIIEELA